MTRRGFTFIEILACMLVVGLGMASAVGMVMYGIGLGSTAQGKATGLVTAMSVACDARPLVAADGWSVSAGGDAEGWVNGFWVERHESAGDAVAPGITSHAVHVDVHEAWRGAVVASYSTRVLRQRVR
ncbi:MAG TPA: prepilin-type N-terminal cleavage/methylation domain-containing protein [Planctomycetota bacterium]|nr:prepilin-type N-terminal cleavage/methylation domain-containing protein [Planctomycetota bacterium]